MTQKNANLFRKREARMFNNDMKNSAVLDSRYRRGLASLPGFALMVAMSASGSALAAEPNPERNAYFGEQHIHTSGPWTPGCSATT
jgi:hypothetical protein